MWNLNSSLSNPTAIFGLRLWVVIAVAVGASLVLLLLVTIPLCSVISHRRRRRRPPHRPHIKPLILHLQDPTPLVSKEIVEISHRPLPPNTVRIDIPKGAVVLSGHQSPPPPASTSGTTASGESRAAAANAAPLAGGGMAPEVSQLGWGQRYTMREVEEATGGLADENVVGEGGYGVVYRGVLPDHTIVAIKNLLNNRGQAEKEFGVEVEAIGRVRHKNLVRLLGYCIEKSHRMLVYEYVDNGNLDQWLHGDVGEVSPLTWAIRMNIILGTAKGLAYLHEGLEPKVVHRDVKSGNILLDRQWNPKVSDFGLAKLMQPEESYLTTRVMGTFGYVSPEYASTGMLNERSDVYSFGVLIMEIISGRTPVDYARPHGEVNLIEWLKIMVGERKFEEVVDPKMPEEPSPKALKRALLVAIRCVDPDAQKRPRMGHVVHMLEMDDLLLRSDHRPGREACDRSPERHNAREEASFGEHDRPTKWRWANR